MLKFMIIVEDQLILEIEDGFLVFLDVFLYFMVDRESGEFLFMFFDLVVETLVERVMIISLRCGRVKQVEFRTFGF
jgi:hypothetical protein